MNKLRSILITGGTGLLGKGMVETAPKNCSIVSLHQRDYAMNDSRANHVVLDIRDKHLVERLFERHQFDAVVHAAGIASVDYVESHYAESLESNIVGTLNVTSACRRSNTHLIYVSTNAVFDGTQAPYEESHPVRPVNKYGCIKVECERLVNETLQCYTVVRPILMYGWNHPVARPNPVTWVFEKLLRGDSIQMVNDVYENPLYNLQCGEALWEIMKKTPAGVIHLAGANILNRYEMALQVAKVFGLDASLIQPVDSSFFPAIAPRPKNTSLVTKRLERELCIRPMKFEAGLRHMKKRMESKV